MAQERNASSRSPLLTVSPQTCGRNDKTLQGFLLRSRPIFVGPKYNVFGENITDKYKNFVEIDYFVTSREYSKLEKG